jgi:hypothetical protein
MAYEGARFRVKLKGGDEPRRPMTAVRHVGLRHLARQPERGTFMKQLSFARSFSSMVIFTLTTAVAGFLLAGEASAQQCTPQYIQLTPTSSVLVGCCNADGTWKTGTSAQRECLNASNMCQKGTCNETTHSCDGSYSNAPGSCVSTSNLCQLGTCSAQQCQVDSDPDAIDYRCEDNNICTNDTVCTGSTYSTLVCPHTADDTQVCDDGDDNPCTATQCSGGTCSGAAANLDGTSCSTASGNTCYPKTCSSGVCTDAGSPIVCSGSIGVCKKWSCQWSGSTSSCTQVAKDWTTYPENDCDDNPHDCNVKRCTAKAKCTGKAPNNLPPSDPEYDPELDDFVCDSNFANPLVDCFGGRCDARKNCVNESVAAGVPAYVGQTCVSDSDLCTVQTCVGTSCNLSGCSTGNCGGCATGPGVCTDTDPGPGFSCSCVQ